MKLTCNEMESLLIDYLDHELQAEQAVSVARHLETCKPCQNRLTEQKEWLERQSSLKRMQLEEPAQQILTANILNTVRADNQAARAAHYIARHQVRQGKNDRNEPAAESGFTEADRSAQSGYAAHALPGPSVTHKSAGWRKFRLNYLAGAAVVVCLSLIGLSVFRNWYQQNQATTSGLLPKDGKEDFIGDQAAALDANREATSAAAMTAADTLAADAGLQASAGELGAWTIYSGSLMDILTIEKITQEFAGGETAVSDETRSADGESAPAGSGTQALAQTMNSEIKQSLADIFSQAEPILILTRSRQDSTEVSSILVLAAYQESVIDQRVTEIDQLLVDVELSRSFTILQDQEQKNNLLDLIGQDLYNTWSSLEISDHEGWLVVHIGG